MNSVLSNFDLSVMIVRVGINYTPLCTETEGLRPVDFFTCYNAFCTMKTQIKFDATIKPFLYRYTAGGTCEYPDPCSHEHEHISFKSSTKAFWIHFFLVSFVRDKYIIQHALLAQFSVFEGYF